ncbi:hypothetical protein [Roseibium sp.]|uniref:hypothetical protein n=1 Tax=Roseibium sp. TaxID=1936156 RepID=UPI003B5205E2
MNRNKLDRPPYVHNWVRYNYPDINKTTKELVGFARHIPTISYQTGLRVAADRILHGLDYRTALKAVSRKGNPNSRRHNTEFIKAFYRFDKERQYSGAPAFDEFVEPFRISKGLSIPVKPTAILSEGGVFKPVFLVGWSSMPLTDFQIRLLMTLIEDAVFSLTDFQSSPGEFLSFPKDKTTGKRCPLVWQRGDFELLSKAELAEQIDLYLNALQKAKSILETDIVEEESSKKPSNERVSEPPVITQDFSNIWGEID